jgi:hypothetical protein
MKRATTAIQLRKHVPFIKHQTLLLRRRKCKKGFPIRRSGPLFF